jgi:predicted nucleic acid-binding protein
MNFAAIPSGALVFVDTNVFVYSYAGDPTFGPACADLLERIQ